MAITKEVLKRCQNEFKQAFCALPEDVRAAMKDNLENVEWFDGLKRWRKGYSFSENLIYRLSPDTPTEPEWYENPVTENLGFNQTTMIGYGCINIVDATGNRNFLGIIYRKDGIETLRTSIDAAFGTPVRVRFSKP